MTPSAGTYISTSLTTSKTRELMSGRSNRAVAKFACQAAPHRLAVQSVLRRICATIQRAVPAATATIRYNIPAFGLNGHTIIYFRAFRKHIRLYPALHRDLALAGAVAPYARPNGSLQFSYDQPIPYDLLVRIARLQAAEALNARHEKPAQLCAASFLPGLAARIADGPSGRSAVPPPS